MNNTGPKDVRKMLWNRFKVEHKFIKSLAVDKQTLTAQFLGIDAVGNLLNTIAELNMPLAPCSGPLKRKWLVSSEYGEKYWSADRYDIWHKYLYHGSEVDIIIRRGNWVMSQRDSGTRQHLYTSLIFRAPRVFDDVILGITKREAFNLSGCARGSTARARYLAHEEALFLDKYGFQCQGLCIVCREFASKAEFSAYVLPEEIQSYVIEEVTDDDRYLDRNLAFPNEKIGD